MTWLIVIVVGALVFSFTSGLAAALLTWVGGLFLGLAAKLLDICLYAFGAKFDVVIYNSLAPVIHQLWGAFRDIANIIIIGMFVFTAISMILGLQSFNARRMVARILIIAVLINFSLLFGRIVIAASNFVATQFYCAMLVNSGNGQGCQTISESSGGVLAAISNSNYGIGLQFMDFLGAKTFTQAQETANEIYKNNSAWYTRLGGSPTGTFFALLYGATAALLMFAAAALFVYISFLLLARGILFIFLLVMSAPAFASFLIPKHGEKYWGMWWSALIRNAIFGPLLIMLLWATFMLSRSLVQADFGSGTSIGGTRSFDKLFSEPTSGAGLLALLVFAIILGMLYASARFANSFAKSVGGLDYAQMFSAAPVTLGSRFLAAPFLRQTVGKWAYGSQKSYANQADELRTQAAEARIRAQTLTGSRQDKALREAREKDRQAAQASIMAERRGALAGSRMNAMDVGLVNKTLKQMGITGLAAGASGKEKGVADVIKKQAEDAAKQAAGLVASENASKDMATKIVSEQRKGDRDTLEKMHKEAMKGVEDTRKAIQESRRDEIKKLEDQQAEHQKIERDATIARGSATSEAAMRAEDQKIKEAREKISAARDALKEINRPIAEAEQKLETARRDIDEFDKETVSKINDMTARIRNDSIKSAAEIAPALVQRRILGVPVRGVSSNSYAGQEAGKKLSGRIKTQRIREQLEAGKDILGADAPAAETKKE